MVLLLVDSVLLTLVARQIQDIMELVKEEMQILSRAEQPGGDAESYINSLDQILDRKVKPSSVASLV